MTRRAPPTQFRSAVQERRAAYTMLLPAALLLGVFLVIPFFMAFYLSLTNQRLISPQPAAFVGLGNYERLFRVAIIRMEPLRDEATGAIVRDEAGRPEYPRGRTLLRAEERFQELREFTQLSLGGRRYLLAAGDPEFLRSILNNLYFVIVVVPVQTSFALLLALLVNQKLRGANAFRTVYFSPVVTTMAVISVLWFFLYNPSEGLINAFLGVLGVNPVNWLGDPRSALPAIMLMSIWQGVGFQMVIFLAGLQDVPEELYEAAEIDGAGALQRFWSITLPSLYHTTVFVAVSSTILAFKLFTQVEVMTFGTGGPANSTLTMVLHLINQGFRQQQVGYASAIAVFFVALVLTLSLVQHRFLTRRQA